jgi:hypothetical protein
LNSIDLNLLSPEQKVFYKRVFSPLDDRVSWIKSIADVALGKSIEKMIDEEEILLMNNVKAFISGLVKASNIHEFNKLNNDKLVSVEFVDEKGVLTKEKIVIDSKSSGDYITIKQDMSNKMVSLSTEQKKQLLFELLNLEINNKIQ